MLVFLKPVGLLKVLLLYCGSAHSNSYHRKKVMLIVFRDYCDEINIDRCSLQRTLEVSFFDGRGPMNLNPTLVVLRLAAAKSRFFTSFVP